MSPYVDKMTKWNALKRSHEKVQPNVKNIKFKKPNLV